MEPESREEGTEHTSRDLLHRFAGSTSLDDQPATASAASDDVELSLGLSLGGCFGSNPRESKTKLIRSSSISSLSIFSRESDFPLAGTALARTCSLPAENEADYRKRKELQTLKRLEVKRKRSEKRNPSSNKLEEGKEYLNGVRARGVPGWAVPPVPALQGSAGSQGSSSSILLDFENRRSQGSSASSSGRMDEEDDDDDPSKKGGGAMDRSMMEEMPCVSTRGDGPNGRRIEGFLYRYRRGEEVRIVCVCHGSFLTPAEFVRHAGGGEVDHPLRHIVVSPTPAFL